MYYRNERSVYLDLFVYGSLCLPKLMCCLTGKKFRGEPASIYGYASYFVQKRDYPGLRLKPECLVTGMVYRNVPRRILKIIDQFEDDFYIRVSRGCKWDSSEICFIAEVYIMKPRCMGRLSSKPWIISNFRENCLIRKLTMRRHGSG